MNNDDSKFTGNNRNTINKRRDLRKNMTKEERHLWYAFLRTYPVKIYRQRTIGKYIVDFYCSKALLAIELDGGGHYDDMSLIEDEIRTKDLETFGVKVIRFTNREVNIKFDGVCREIDRVIKERTAML